MSTIGLKTFSIALCLTLGVACTDVRAEFVDVVTNGGFETGDLTGWQLGGSANFTNTYVSTAAAYQGNYGVAFGPPSTGISSLSQVIATVPGQAYQISYFVGNDVPMGAPQYEAGIQLSFGGQQVDYIQAAAELPYAGRGGGGNGIVATSSQTLLEFTAQTAPDGGTWFLDDIEVLTDVPVATTPLPASGWLFICGAALLGMETRRRRINRA